MILSSANFDGLYGQDAYAYYNFSGQITQNWKTGAPLGAFFWPLGYPTLLALGRVIGGDSPTVGLLINIILGSALAPLSYIIAYRLTDHRGSALLGGLVMTACGQAIQSSVVLMADIPALFWVTISIMCLLNAIEGGRTVWIIASASALALACVTRWLCLTLWPAWLVVVAVHRAQFSQRSFWLASLCVGCIFLPQWLYSQHNPYPTLNHEWVVGWSPQNIFASQFNNIDGQFAYEQNNFVFYSRLFYDEPYLFLLFTPLFILGGAHLVFMRAPIQHLLILYWALAPTLFLMGIPYQNIRFPLLGFPAVACLVAIGYRVIHPSKDGLKLTWQLVGSALMIIGITHSLSAGIHTTRTFISAQIGDKAAVQWAKESLPSRAQLFTSGLTLAFQAQTDFTVYELYYETTETLAGKLAPLDEAFVMLNVWQIRHQWAGHELEKLYDWLLNNDMQPIGRHGNYTLFTIRP